MEKKKEQEEIVIVEDDDKEKQEEEILMEEETKEEKMERRIERIEEMLQKHDGRIKTWKYVRKEVAEVFGAKKSNGKENKRD